MVFNSELCKSSLHNGNHLVFRLFFSSLKLFLYNLIYDKSSGFPHSSVSKESACNAADLGSIAGSGSLLPWRRKWQPTPVFLPGESHGQRSLAVSSSWGRKEPDTTEVTQPACPVACDLQKPLWIALPTFLSLVPTQFF